MEMMQHFPDRARGRRRPRSAGGEEKENEDDHDHDQEAHEDEHHERKLVASKSFLLFCHCWPPVESEQIDEMLAETRELSGRQYQKGPVYVECI
jgi:hypothetical protein